MEKFQVEMNGKFDSILSFGRYLYFAENVKFWNFEFVDGRYWFGENDEEYYQKRETENQSRAIFDKFREELRKKHRSIELTIVPWSYWDDPILFKSTDCFMFDESKKTIEDKCYKVLEDVVKFYQSVWFKEYEIKLKRELRCAIEFNDLDKIKKMVTPYYYQEIKKTLDKGEKYLVA